MSYSIIAAVGKNGELGANNDLIWHLKEDLKFFKNITTGHTIIMGKNTFYSLKRLLPNRHHVVLSSHNDFPNEVEVFHNLEDLLNTYNDVKEELFVIGGSSVYKAFLSYADKMYLTEIDDEYKDADVYFPEFDRDEYYREVIGEITDSTPQYKHVLYRKK